MKNAELGSYIQKAEGLVNNKPTEAYNELIRVLEGQENIRKELYTYCNFEEEEIVSESTET